MRSRPFLKVLSVFALLVGFALPAAADDLDTPSRVVAATVYTRAAEVVREANVSIPAGAHAVVLGGLPANLLADTIRVEGETDGTLIVGAVDTKRQLVPEASSKTLERQRIERLIEVLEDRSTAARDAIAAAQARKSLATNLATLPSRAPGDAASGPRRSPQDWQALGGLIVAEFNVADAAIREANTSLRTLGKKIEDLRRQLAGIAPQRVSRTQVKINVDAATDLTGTLTIRYQVADAGWSPIYEARLDAGNAQNGPKLSLMRRASVYQSTGETWEDIPLVLSTTRPGRGTAMPRVDTLRAEFRPKLSKTRRSGGLMSLESAQDAVVQPEPAAAPPAKPRSAGLRKAVTRRQAAVVDGAFQTNYMLSGRHTVASDDGAKAVDIDTLTFQPKLRVRIAPRKRAAAFLHADITLGETQRLLPGAVSLFRDGVFVGRGRLPVLVSGETHELGFGEDDRVRVTRATLSEQTGESGILSTTKTDTRRYRTTITNAHVRPVSIRVFDQLPVAADDAIEVTLASDTTSPTERDHEDKPGILVWDFNLPPGAERVINFGYDMAWPDGRALRLREVRTKRVRKR
ncbi:MAG: mucoidy inhibitor MuiA family protein [Pseudomonadota bacterium]